MHTIGYILVFECDLFCCAWIKLMQTKRQNTRHNRGDMVAVFRTHTMFQEICYAPHILTRTHTKRSSPPLSAGVNETNRKPSQIRRIQLAVCPFSISSLLLLSVSLWIKWNEQKKSAIPFDLFVHRYHHRAKDELGGILLFCDTFGLNSSTRPVWLSAARAVCSHMIRIHSHRIVAYRMLIAKAI